MISCVRLDEYQSKLIRNIMLLSLCKVIMVCTSLSLFWRAWTTGIVVKNNFACEKLNMFVRTCLVVEPSRLAIAIPTYWLSYFYSEQQAMEYVRMNFDLVQHNEYSLSVFMALTAIFGLVHTPLCSYVSVHIKFKVFYLFSTVYYKVFAWFFIATCVLPFAVVFLVGCVFVELYYVFTSDDPKDWTKWGYHLIVNSVWIPFTEEQLNNAKELTKIEDSKREKRNKEKEKVL